MKAVLFTICALLFCVFLAEAQTEDGAAEISPEQVKSQLQFQGAQKLQQIDPEQAIKMLMEVTQKSKKSDWFDLLYESGTLLAKMHFAKEQYRKAANAAEDAIEAAKSLKDEDKTLAGLQLLKDIYTADGRSRRLSEVDEEYTQLKTALDLDARNEQYAELEDSFGEATAEMEELIKELGEKEIARRLLENRTLNLENENLENELKLEKEAQKVAALNEKTRKQQARLLQVSLVALIIFILAGGYIWFVRNKRKQDAEQAYLKQQLLQKDKMATLGEMTAGVAHEIKNPLNFVNNFAEGSIDMLEDLQETLKNQLGNLSEDDREDVAYLLQELRQNAEDIHKQGQRADAIINGMMNHARGGSSESSLANINDLLQDSWELAVAGAGVKYPDLKVNFRKDLSEHLPEIRVIPQDLNRAFLNIFNNSLEAFSERNISGAEVQLQTAVNGDQVLIQIKDNAGGIPEGIQNKVFNPFFTTKPTGKGNTGLGLSIVNDIIEKGHDGTISLQSDARESTKIIIKLPLMTR